MSEESVKSGESNLTEGPGSSGIKPQIPSETLVPHTKPKRVPSQAQLDALAKARQLAAEKRKELGNITKKEKEITKEAKDKLLNQRLEKIKTLEQVAQEQPKKNKNKKVVSSSSSETSSSSSDSDSTIESKVIRRTP
jgi:hypothetical protein